MRLINRIIVDENLNAKAKDLAPFLRMYDGCLMTAEGYRETVQQIKELCAALNSQHPRTKPFEIYGLTDNGIYIVPEGKPEQRVASLSVHKVASLSVHKVASVYETNEGICPVDMFTLLMTEDYVEACS